MKRHSDSDNGMREKAQKQFNSAASKAIDHGAKKAPTLCS